MNKIAKYLSEHISGEVVTSPSIRKFFSTDGGVFEALPQFVIYPKNDLDVRKVMRFAWQLAEKGHRIPVTARGKGTDQGGAAIGKGICLVLPAHMDRLIQLDVGKGLAVVQPGANYRNIQDTFNSHGLFLPPYPSSIDLCTIGGAIANNSAGEKTIKYGDTRQYVRQLKVVLANGDIIETRKLNKRELSQKLGQDDFEGEIYRQLDQLLTENAELVKKIESSRHVTKHSTGYDLSDIKHKDGFDLTPLFVGSQGTLGVITEAEIELEGYNPHTNLIAAEFDSLDAMVEATNLLVKLNPSALEVVDKHLLDFVQKYTPAKLKGVLKAPFPQFVLLVEFDDPSDRARKKLSKRAVKILKDLAKSWQESTDPEEQQKLWEIRHSAAAVIWHTEGPAKALPIIEDGIVPREQFGAYIKEIYAIFNKLDLEVALWGHAGDANLHMQPFLDLGKVGDRQKVFKLMDEYYGMVRRLGGGLAAEHGDGRLRAPYLEEFSGKDIYALYKAVKNIFDPRGILNTGVKIDVTKAETMTMLRHSYDMAHLSEHLPKV